MDYDEIFEQYYTDYRAEAATPNSADDEYVIGKRLANSGIRRWASYDNTMWKELFVNAVTAGEGITTQVGKDSYDLPDDFRDLGGMVRVLDSNGNVKQRIPVVEPQDVQFIGKDSTAAWRAGNKSTGLVLRLNVPSTESGLTLDFDYYKWPSKITKGADIPEMSDPDFLVDHMLASRFRSSRNPYYSTAKRDAENKLGQMKMANDSGSWANPWTLPDRSGSIWGGESSKSSLVL